MNKVTEHLASHSFLQMPRWLLKKDLGPYEILLYTYILDLSKVSEQNGKQDEKGSYVFLTLEQARQVLKCSTDKAVKTFRKLEEQQLLKRVQQGCNRANLYYPILPNLPPDISSPVKEVPKPQFHNSWMNGSTIDHDAIMRMPPPF